MASRLYSRELAQKVSRANRIISRERERQATAETLQEIGAEVKLQRLGWGKTALKFAEKEIEKIFGKGAEAFTLKDATPEQIAKIEEAVERVLESPMLTEKGRREFARENTARFFRKDPEDVTRREMNLLAALDNSGLLDKMKDLGMQYDILFDALQQGSDFANRTDISLQDKVNFLDALVNNKNGFQEQFTVNGAIDYYGALGEYFGSTDFSED